MLQKKSEHSTVLDELKRLLGPNWVEADIFSWPPDLFAVCAWLLEASGAYVRVLENWPPDGMSIDKWQKRVQAAAAALLENTYKTEYGTSISGPALELTRVKELWAKVITYAHIRIEDIVRNEELAAILIELVAIADEASGGFGVPPLPTYTITWKENRLLEDIQVLLSEGGTLTPRFPTTTLYVLPKQHTPQAGMTLRSLSHHLALFTGGEVQPAWSVHNSPRGDHLNLLIIPWPFVVKPSQFREANCPGVRQAEGFRCFDYVVPHANDLLGGHDNFTFRDWLTQLFVEAEAVTGKIDGVVVPEAAIRPEDFQVLDEIAFSHGAFVVAGVAGPATDGFEQDQNSSTSSPTSGCNEVWMAFGTITERSERTIRQGKHHRWRLDQSQLEMYGLGGSLDPRYIWWENIPVRSRDVNFVSLHAHMTVCCLVCEDLARQDPVSNLVRAVGPNLVIAILADGPQLSTRWPARYATVLADDPGSSVLTVTNLGMTQLAEPPPGKFKSHTIALWKDAFGGLREIVLGPDSSGIVLNLWTKCTEEWTADCRMDKGVAASPSLGGVHQIKLPKPLKAT